MKRSAALFGACSLSLGLVFGAAAPAAFADDARPAREDYASALDTAYRGNLMDMGAKDSDIDAFGDCVVTATYDKMSAEAVAAIANDDFDYQLQDTDATVFLEATESCLESAGLSELAASSGQDAAGGAEGSSEAQDSSGAATQEEMDKAAESAASAEDEPAAPADSSASWRLPLVMGLFVVAILALSGYLVLTNRAKAARRSSELEQD